MIAVGAGRRFAAVGARRRDRQPAFAARKFLGAAIPLIIVLGAIGGLLLAVDPRSIAGATSRFDVRLVVPLLLLGIAFYALQGLRWHLLLRDIGVRERVRDTELINFAGQAATAVLPLGDLTRALLASESSGVEFGAAAATVTVQELTFTLLLVLAATPGLARLPGGVAWMATTVAGVAGILVILTVPRVFATVLRLASRTPGLHRLLPQIEALQREVRQLLRRPDVIAGSAFDLGRVIVATASLYLVLRGLGIDTVSWWGAALVLAVSYVGGAISLLPGGVGANEASVVGVLVLLGVDPASAAAAAILQRLSLSGIATVGGAAAYLGLRRSLHLTGAGGLRALIASTRTAGQTANRPAPTTAVAAPVP
jgi:uncharacterized protein (TIRG00374 family)